MEDLQKTVSKESLESGEISRREYVVKMQVHGRPGASDRAVRGSTIVHRRG